MTLTNRISLFFLFYVQKLLSNIHPINTENIGNSEVNCRTQREIPTLRRCGTGLAHAKPSCVYETRKSARSDSC
jgi:hypothetical protein